MFPTRLDSPLAYDIAKAMMDGFNRHYRLFRTESARAKHRFETADWHGQQRSQRERIEFYDLRVLECSNRLEREFKAGEQPMEVWQQIKLLYIGLLVDHHQPELAETFFNSVTTKILHRSYFQNDFIFVRPAVSTEYIESSEAESRPTYRAYYPTRETMQATALGIVHDFDLRLGFEDLERDTARVAQVMREQLGDFALRANFQVQVLTGLFFRNKGCYIVGKLINGFQELGFALPVLHGKTGLLRIDAALFGEEDLLMLFSFARAYFMVDEKTRCTSLDSWSNSLSRDSLSVSELDALAACTANSRIRCKMSLDFPSAPSAVCAMDIPSLALRTATFMPRTWELIRSAIAKPAASSLALFTRRPDDKRAMVVASEF
jgi:isocitrate dehydrogenase kinase/phosphatase